jgi:hypothetical protein
MIPNKERPVTALTTRQSPNSRVRLTATVERTLREPVAIDAAPMDVAPVDDRDALTALLSIYDLWTEPLGRLGGREVHQANPEVVRVKARLDAWFVERLDLASTPPRAVGEDAVDTMRRIAAADLVPPVYEWLAEEATWDQLVTYLALEGGPDADFDDLVAVAQVGIAGDPKVALGANYWDEMGRGHLDAVHTELHAQLVDAVDMPRFERRELPVPALERMALNGLLATSRALQPEMIGALGLLEMQAGPRCRAVVRALRRLDAPPDSLPFYEEHARADPIHGKEWLIRVVAPLSAEPRWAAGMIRGARWRATVNNRFFAEARNWCHQMGSRRPSEAMIA